MAGVQLRLAVFRGELDMLFTALILHPQLVIRRGSEDIASVVVPVNVIRVF
ncbi:hypothetical protein D3C75_1111320 [compost metagenome]